MNIDGKQFNQDRFAFKGMSKKKKKDKMMEWVETDVDVNFIKIDFNKFLPGSGCWLFPSVDFFVYLTKPFKIRVHGSERL
mgnify:CR=1 FL=1